MINYILFGHVVFSYMQVLHKCVENAYIVPCSAFVCHNIFKSAICLDLAMECALIGIVS